MKKIFILLFCILFSLGNISFSEDTEPVEESTVQEQKNQEQEKSTWREKWNKFHEQHIKPLMDNVFRKKIKDIEPISKGFSDEDDTLFMHDTPYEEDNLKEEEARNVEEEKLKAKEVEEKKELRAKEVEDLNKEISIDFVQKLKKDSTLVETILNDSNLFKILSDVHKQDLFEYLADTNDQAIFIKFFSNKDYIEQLLATKNIDLSLRVSIPRIKADFLNNEKVLSNLLEYPIILKALSDEQKENIDLQNISADQISKLPEVTIYFLLSNSALVSKFSEEQVQAINPETLSKVLYEKLPEPLPSEFVKNLSLEQIEKLFRDHVGWSKDNFLKNWFTYFKSNLNKDDLALIQKKLDNDLKLKGKISLKDRLIKFLNTLKTFKHIGSSTKDIGTDIKVRSDKTAQNNNEEEEALKFAKELGHESLTKNKITQLKKITQNLSEEKKQEVFQNYMQEKNESNKTNFFNQFENLGLISSQAAKELKIELLIQARNQVLVAQPKEFQDMAVDLGLVTESQVFKINELFNKVKVNNLTVVQLSYEIEHSNLNVLGKSMLLRRVEDLQKINDIALNLDPQDSKKGLYGIENYDQQAKIKLETLQKNLKEK